MFKAAEELQKRRDEIIKELEDNGYKIGVSWDFKGIPFLSVSTQFEVENYDKVGYSIVDLDVLVFQENPVEFIKIELESAKSDYNKLLNNDKNV